MGRGAGDQAPADRASRGGWGTRGHPDTRSGVAWERSDPRFLLACQTIVRSRRVERRSVGGLSRARACAREEVVGVAWPSITPTRSGGRSPRLGRVRTKWPLAPRRVILPSPATEVSPQCLRAPAATDPPQIGTGDPDAASHVLQRGESRIGAPQLHHAPRPPFGKRDRPRPHRLPPLAIGHLTGDVLDARTLIGTSYTWKRCPSGSGPTTSDRSAASASPRPSGSSAGTAPT